MNKKIRDAINERINKNEVNRGIVAAQNIPTRIPFEAYTYASKAANKKILTEACMVITNDITKSSVPVTQ